MNKRTIGFLLIALGIAGMLVSLAADMIGIGTYPGINGAQLLGVVVSLLVVLTGGWLARSGAARKL